MGDELSIGDRLSTGDRIEGVGDGIDGHLPAHPVYEVVAWGTSNRQGVCKKCGKALVSGEKYYRVHYWWARRYRCLEMVTITTFMKSPKRRSLLVEGTSRKSTYLSICVTCGKGIKQKAITLSQIAAAEHERFYRRIEAQRQQWEADNPELAKKQAEREAERRAERAKRKAEWDNWVEAPIESNYPTFLYRFYGLLFGKEHLYYVGITYHLGARLAEHEAQKGWFPQVTRVEATKYPTRREAEEAERVAIETENPRHNKNYGVGIPGVRTWTPQR